MKRILNQLGFVLAVVATATTVGVAAAVDIELRTQASPRGTVVLLSDVAKISAASDQDAARLGSVPLMPAPSAGTRRFLRMREIQDLLSAHGEDLAQLNFRGGAVVEISAQSNEAHSSPRQAVLQGRTETKRKTIAPTPKLDAMQVREINNQISSAIIKHLTAVSGRKANWQVSFNLSPAEVTSFAKAVSQLQCSGGHAPWTGKQRFVFSFETTSGNDRFPVFAVVRASHFAVLATRRIERGEVLTAASVEVRELDHVPAASGRRTPVEAIEPLIGMEAARAIGEGDVVFNEDVRPQLLVKRGDEVSVMARGGGIRVRTLARALQDGARGELISVEAPENKESYDAVVVGLREAVVFSGAAAPSQGEIAVQPFRRPRK